MGCERAYGIRSQAAGIAAQTSVNPAASSHFPAPAQRARAGSGGHSFARISTHAPEGGNTWQFRKFTDDEAAVTWLVTQYKAKLTALRANPAITRENLDTYLGTLATAMGTYEKLAALLTATGGDLNTPEGDRTANLARMSNPDVPAAAMKQIREAEVALYYGREGAKRQTVSAAQKEHIFLGEENPARTLTGYHWEGDPASVAVGSGTKQNAEAKFGVYQKAVVARRDASIRKAGGSATASTFFPDTWTKPEILEAIEFALPVGGKLEAQTPAKARGLHMESNPSSYFPSAPGEQPT